MAGGAEEELERRSKFLSSLIQKKKAVEQQEQHDRLNVRVRASDMPVPLQNKAFRCARDHLDAMRGGKLDSKRIALALKKVKTLASCFLLWLSISLFSVAWLFRLLERFTEMLVVFGVISFLRDSRVFV